jgi:IS66 Orf2 like protein
MRKSYDGLQALARHAMHHDPLDGALYIFVNRRGSQLKCLYFDRSGFCIWGKRLEAGRFISDWRAVRTREMDWRALRVIPIPRRRAHAASMETAFRRQTPALRFARFLSLIPHAA